jgi:hypothetical protein
MAEQKSPFGEGSSGSGAFKAAYDRLKAEAEARKQGIGQDYSSAYQQLRQQGYGMGLGASAQKGLSGGQAEGVRGAISAQQMGQLGNLMQGQEKALREAKLGESSIYSNALLEGQQAQQYSIQNAQSMLQLQQQLTALEEGGIDETERAVYNQIVAALGQSQPSANAMPGQVGTSQYGRVGVFGTQQSAQDSISNLPKTPGYRYETRYDNNAGGYVVFAISPGGRAYPVSTQQNQQNLSLRR